MDQAKYLMLARRRLSDQKPIFTTPHVAVGSSAPYYDSWEERAFAEDSVGHLGGCIWPPRSYSCTFCSREFRSAQALGGHMNVHRRDRARLKLAAAAADDSASDPRQNYMMHPCHSEDGPPHRGYSQNHSAANANPNPNSICSVLAYPSRSLSHADAKSCWGEHIMNSSLIPPLAGNDHGKKEVFIGPVQLAEEHSKTAARVCSNTELHVGSGELELYTVLGCRTWRDFEGDDDYDDEELVGSSSKRRRIDLSSSPLILNSSAGKYQQLHGGNDDLGKVLKLYPSSPVEELDLELRLGEAPKVK